MPRASAGVRSARFRKYGPRIRTLFAQMNLPDPLRPQYQYLARLSTRDDIVSLIAPDYPIGSAGHDQIMLAHDIAIAWHGTRRRHSGEKECRHLYRCFLRGYITYEIRHVGDLCLLWLHDITETFRRQWPFERIGALFGDYVETGLRFLTKPVQKRGQTKRDVERHYYLVQLAAAPPSIVLLKGIDNEDNLCTLWKRSIKRVLRKIDDTIRYGLPLYRRKGPVKLCRTIIRILWFIRKKIRNGESFSR